jgi:hypothetical protein
MRKQLSISVFVATFFALSAGSAVAQIVGATVGDQGSANIKVAEVSGTPPHTSDTGKTKRSSTAETKGANNPNFCPPGQAKKKGKGSAFNC